MVNGLHPHPFCLHEFVKQCRSADAVLAFVELIKAKFGNGRWVSPEGMSLPYVVGTKMDYKRDGVVGGTRTKWGIEEDINWFGACPNTSWNSTFFYAVLVQFLSCLCHQQASFGAVQRFGELY